MADLQVFETVRRALGDEPKVEFNETLSDGTNAAWRLTNSPVELASESVFVSGVVMQTTSSVTTLKAPGALGDYTLTLNADVSLFKLGDQIALDFEPNPERYAVTAKDAGTITVSRRIKKDYVTGTTVYRLTPQYTFDYEAGIIYFTAVPQIGARLACKFRHYKFTDKQIDGMISDATDAVSSDVGSMVSTGDAFQKSLIILKLREQALRRELRAGAGNAIKIKQGSTSLDLTGATSVAQRELEGIAEEYQRALKNYLWNLQDESVGAAVVGREGYIQE